MLSIGMPVNEIVYTRDNAFMYAYIHLQQKTRKEELERAMEGLSSIGVIGTNIFGYNGVDGSSHGSSEFIEEHPGFMTLVQHQANGNRNFSRLIAKDFDDTNSGFNKLKKKVLAKSAQSARGGGGNSRASAGTGKGSQQVSGSSHPLGVDPSFNCSYPASQETSSDEEEHVPAPSTDGRSKRRRAVSHDMSKNYVEIFMEKMSSVVASAISSSGSAVTSAVASERDRLERAEHQLREIEMQRRLSEEYRRIEKDVAGRYEAKLQAVESELLEVRREYTAAVESMKAELAVVLAQVCFVSFLVCFF